MVEDKVSVILPTFSRFEGGYLERAIQSVLSQTYENFELIIVDDCSVDGSEQLIRRYSTQDSRIRNIRLNKNIGLPALTTALGYNISSGNYIAWIFDDCVYKPHHLQVLKDAIDQSSNSVSFGLTELNFADHKTIIGSNYSRDFLLTGNNCIGNAAVMIKRNVVEKIGWYDPHVILKRYCDWDYWLRISKVYDFCCVSEVVVEEHGIKLSDSLGNSNMTYPAISLKYSSIERNEKLNPASLEANDPYFVDFGVLFTEVELKLIHAMINEHFVRTMNVDKIISRSREFIRRNDESILWERISAQTNTNANIDMKYVIWGFMEYINQLTNNSVELRQLIQKQQAYIDEQQSYIDKQQSYIDNILTIAQVE